MNLINLLAEEVQPFNPTTSFYVGFWALILILLLPWVFLLVYCLTLKYRIRLFSGNILVGSYKLKANAPILASIELPKRNGYKIEGLYRDEEFMLPLEYEKMPKENLKIYIKWVEETNTSENNN